jgi:hypothetical protein
MKRWQKIVITVAACVAAFTVVAVIVLFSALPDPSAIGKSLRSRRAAADRTQPNAQLANSANKTPPSALAENLGGTAQPSPTPAVDLAERKRRVTDAFLDRYMSDERIRSRVCENLAESPAPFKNSTEFGQQVESSLLGETKPSAAVEAVMLPIEFTLKNEAVRELVRAAEEATARGDTGFLQKAEFYAQAARATASVLSTRAELEAISANAYRLYALSRAAALKPELLSDPDMTDLCRGFERSALDGIARDEAFDRDRLNRLLSRHGISAASIDYDPNMSTALRVDTSEGGLQIKTPWLDRIFKKQ